MLLELLLHQVLGGQTHVLHFLCCLVHMKFRVKVMCSTQGVVLTQGFGSLAVLPGDCHLSHLYSHCSWDLRNADIQLEMQLPVGSKVAMVTNHERGFIGVLSCFPPMWLCNGNFHGADFGTPQSTSKTDYRELVILFFLSYPYQIRLSNKQQKWTHQGDLF